jgi:hypothetical protein
MKKLKTMFVAVAVLLAISAFASPGPEKISERVKAEFEKNFTGALNVSWEKKDDFYFASFKLNEKEVSAAYNESGELLGVSRVIETSQLPLNVSLAIANRYKDYTVANTVSEIVFDGQTNYYVSVENNQKILKLKCSSYGEITVERKTKK